MQHVIGLVFWIVAWQLFNFGKQKPSPSNRAWKVAGFDCCFAPLQSQYQLLLKVPKTQYFTFAIKFENEKITLTFIYTPLSSTQITLQYALILESSITSLRRIERYIWDEKHVIFWRPPPLLWVEFPWQHAREICWRVPDKSSSISRAFPGAQASAFGNGIEVEARAAPDFAEEVASTTGAYHIDFKGLW